MQAVEAPTAQLGPVHHGNCRRLLVLAPGVTTTLQQLVLLQAEVEVIVLAAPALVLIGESIYRLPVLRTERGDPTHVVRVRHRPGPALNLAGELHRPGAPAVVHGGLRQKVYVLHDNAVERRASLLCILLREVEARVEEPAAVEQLVVELLHDKDNPGVADALRVPGLGVGLDALPEALEVGTAIPEWDDKGNGLVAILPVRAHVNLLVLLRGAVIYAALARAVLRGGSAPARRGAAGKGPVRIALGRLPV
mmetsp:Transcript_46928/g.147176  ORF Transcript_46928/g.147176 Transcript_46928/m.147176 type:complete len:251 (-) Transcript_46928:503-1255(-)